MPKCSFSKISIQGTFKPRWGFHTDLYCRLLYLQSDGEQALICAFDTLNIWGSDALKFRKEISNRCNIPEKSIVFHELQIHAAPAGRTVSEAMDQIIDRVAKQVTAMIENAQEYTCEVCEAYFGNDCSFNREQYVEGLGGVTVWTGMGFNGEGKACTSDEGIMLLRDYRPGLETLKEPLMFDNANDPYAYLFVFKNKSGKVIGTMARFAAHPDVAVLFELRPVEGKAEMYRYDHDWPGYLCSYLEEEFGGEAIYVNGPCADLSTKKGYEGIDDFISSDGECRRIGRLFADKLISAFKEDSKQLKSPELLRTETFKITVPMREDMPKTVEESKNQQVLIEKAKNSFDNAKTDPTKTPAQVKRAVDDYWKALYNGMMVEICGFTDGQLKERSVELYIPCLRLGEYTFIGVPGESLTETATWLRSAFTGSKTIPLDQCNGYYSYMATPRTLTLGGYTYWCSWTNRDTVPTMQHLLIPKIRKFLQD